jgi:hypothetical protein
MWGTPRSRNRIASQSNPQGTYQQEEDFMRSGILSVVSLLGFLGALLFLGNTTGSGRGKPSKALIEKGKYLVTSGLCADCHSPKLFGPNGPVPDTTRFLSGAPASNTIPEFPAAVLGVDKWGVVASHDLTTWAGPWGISFARNLTPDPVTGIGSWTEDMFIKALRTGKHMGEGRPILPPMPWAEIRKMKDDDLKAMFAYLQSLPPIENAVPEPIPPPQY